MNVFLLYLSGIIAFAIIYNSSTISIMERTRELATLRVMGFTLKEVSKIIFYENYLLSLIGLILGYPFGMLICRLLVIAYETELYEWPYYIQGKTFFLTALFIAVFVTVANFMSRRRLKRIDLLEALKTRE
ncbi:ABC transporter permease [Candidatus Sumerlaeota bacterium]|nr:ABC transporter permease [Candidatus Sumerlaeota bacterium]